MKVVSVLIFAVALIGSWAMVHAKKPVTESMHIGIQNDLRNIITEYVAKNLPESKNLRFEKIWTETLSKDQVKAYFVYTFEDRAQNGEPALVEINGSVVLNKVDESADMTTWDFKELKILDNKVEFEQPIQITAGSGELEGQSAPQPPATEAPKKEEGHH